MDPNLLQFAFDATQYEPFMGGSKTYPAGTYLMAITDLVPQLVRGSTENGMLRVEYTIYSEPHMSEKYNEFLNLWHTNDSAREISLRKLSAICHVVGKLQVQNLSELANILMLNELDYQEATQGGIDATGREVKAQPARNNIIRREPYTDEAAAAAQPHKPMNPPFQASQNAAQAAAAPSMGSPMPQASQLAQQAATPPQRQTPPPFAATARPNGQTPPPFQAVQQPSVAQPQVSAAATPPWLQPKQ